MNGNSHENGFISKMQTLIIIPTNINEVQYVSIIWENLDVFS